MVDGFDPRKLYPLFGWPSSYTSSIYGDLGPTCGSMYLVRDMMVCMCSRWAMEQRGLGYSFAIHAAIIPETRDFAVDTVLRPKKSDY